MLFNFDKNEHWSLTVSRYWWETLPVVGYDASGRSELLLLGTIFKEWFCRVASCCFYMFLTDSYLLFWTDFPFLVEATAVSIYGMCFLFWGLGASFYTNLFFSHMFRVLPPDNLSSYQGTLFFLSDFLTDAVGDVNSVNIQSVTIEGELVRLELFSQTSTFILKASF